MEHLAGRHFFLILFQTQTLLTFFCDHVICLSAYGISEPWGGARSQMRLPSRTSQSWAGEAGDGVSLVTDAVAILFCCFAESSGLQATAQS